MTSRHCSSILIVDDEVHILKSIEYYLLDAGYKVFTAVSASEAFQIVCSSPEIDGILLDINLPDSSGLSLLRQIVSLKSDIAVLMITGNGSEDLAVESMKAGAADYITKPFNFNDLLLRLEKACKVRHDRIEKRRLELEREDFIMMLSHDMKNPLTAIIGTIDIVREGCLGAVNEEQQEYLHSAIDSCNEVVAMIDNLLDLNKFERGTAIFECQRYSASELVGKIAAQYSRPASYEDIKLDIFVDSESGDILVEKLSFSRVLGNLLGNALKFTPIGGRIEVSCSSIRRNEIELPPSQNSLTTGSPLSASEQLIRISVSDSGCGIPPNQLERIFDRYAQFPRESGRERPGAGLGLAYCKKAVEMFNGVIWAESEIDSGTRITILLPSAT